MELVRDGGRDRATSSPRVALRNAARAVTATAGSTNAALHLLAIAHEAGVPSTLEEFEAAARTPVIADLKPGGRYTAADMFEHGGTRLVARELRAAGLIEDIPTVTGRSFFARSSTTCRQRRRAGRGAPGRDRRSSRAAATRSCTATSRPEGCIVKLAGHGRERFEGPARVFDSARKPRSPRCRRAQIQRRRRRRDPLRRPGRRPRHARDARGHRGTGRPGPGQRRRVDHRRPLQRRDPRLHGRPHRAGSRARRADRAAARRRPRRASMSTRARIDVDRRPRRAATRWRASRRASRTGVLAKYARAGQFGFARRGHRARSARRPPHRRQRVDSLRRDRNRIA